MKKNGIEVFEGVQRLKKMRFILKRSLLFLFVSVFFLQAGKIDVKFERCYY